MLAIASTVTDAVTLLRRVTLGDEDMRLESELVRVESGGKDPKLS